jgi:hypothetical protein
MDTSYRTKTNKPKKPTTNELKKINTTNPIKTVGKHQVVPNGKHFLFLIRHPPCYSSIRYFV